MPNDPYDMSYFDSYLERGRLSGRLRGDRKSAHSFWVAFLNRFASTSAEVIEVGCGLGFFGARISKRHRYTGVDLSIEGLTRASQLHNLDIFVCGCADQLPYKDSCCDVIFAFDLVEHLATPEKFFKEAYRVLRPQGVFIMTTPNIRSFGVRMKSSSTALVPAMLRDRTHVSLFPRDEWFALVTAAGFQIEKSGTDGLWDIPYSTLVPLVIEKALLVPLNSAVTRLFGFLPWTLGENLVLVARK